MLKKILISLICAVSTSFVHSQNVDASSIDLPTAKATGTSSVIEAPAAFKINKLLYNISFGTTASNIFVVYAPLNTPPFCKNSIHGGPGKTPIAYVDMSEPSSKLMVAGLMQAYQEGKSVLLRVVSVFDTSLNQTWCKISYFYVY